MRYVFTKRFELELAGLRTVVNYKLEGRFVLVEFVAYRCVRKKQQE